MLGAALATLFFSLSVIFAARSVRLLGAPRANVLRITIALGALAGWAHGFGGGLRGPALPWFLLSGFIGFGLGDLALFGALPRLGPRLSILLTQCLAAPIAAATEWAWLGTRLHPAELLCAAVILAGVALALAPDHGWEGSRRVFRVGVLFGVGSALGQALGAVTSRHAYEVAQAAGSPLDGGTAAYQRIVAGAVVTWVAAWVSLRRAPRPAAGPPQWARGWLPAVGNALAGPVIGVASFQWALLQEPSGVVLPIVATSPLVTMVLGFLLEGHRPTRRAAGGGLLAVGGVVLLKRLQAG